MNMGLDNQKSISKEWDPQAEDSLGADASVSFDRGVAAEVETKSAPVHPIAEEEHDGFGLGV